MRPYFVSLILFEVNTSIEKPTCPTWINKFSVFVCYLSNLTFCFVCFVTGVTSQKCRRAPHSKLCQSPSAFQTQGWFECQESHVRNLTSINVCILSRNFPSGVSSRFTIEINVNPPWGYATRGCELICRSQMTRTVPDTLRRHICHGPRFPKQMHPHRMS